VWVIALETAKGYLCVCSWTVDMRKLRKVAIETTMTHPDGIIIVYI
jgi:hypothetical protein